MSSLLGGVKSQVGGLVEHVGKRIAGEPLEVVKNAVGANDQGSENQGLEMLEQGAGSQVNQSQQGGQKTLADDPQAMKKYLDLAGRRDEIELRRLRKRLHQEFGVPVGVEEGMQRARQEREQRKRQEEQMEEQKKKQEKLMLEEQKKQEGAQVAAAKAQASAERGIGRRIAG